MIRKPNKYLTKNDPATAGSFFFVLFPLREVAGSVLTPVVCAPYRKIMVFVSTERNTQ